MKFKSEHAPDYSKVGAAAVILSRAFYKRRPLGLNVQFMSDDGTLDEWSFADNPRRDAFTKSLKAQGRAFALSE